MPGVVQVQASPVEVLLPSDQSPISGSVATSPPIASDNVSTGHTQRASQPQISLITAIHVSTTTPHATANFSGSIPTVEPGSESIFPIKALVDAEPVGKLIEGVSNRANVVSVTTQDTSSPSVYQHLKVPKGASTTLQPSTLTDDLDPPNSDSETVLAKSGSMSVRPSIASINSGLVLSTETIKAKTSPESILTTSQTLLPIPSLTLDSKLPSVTPFLKNADTQSLSVSDSGSSLPPHAVIIPDPSLEPSLVTTSGHTMAIDSLGQYSLSGQTMTSGGAITVSGTKTSLGHKGGHVVLGTSTGVIWPSVAQPSLVTTDGHTMTVDSLSQYPSDSQSLTSGGSITVSGTKIPLARNGTGFVSGTSTGINWPSVTAKISSVPNVTEAQTFKGNTVGARDGLWGSSMLLLVGMVVLLRL